MLKKKIVVGITGSLCTGKSTVAKMFSEFGAEVIDADVLAHRALRDAKIKKRVTALLGRGVLTAGKIDRKKVRGLVFDNRALLARLSGIIHPYVKKRLKALIKKSKSAVVVLDVPLLIEAGLEKIVDLIVLVTSGRQSQIQRAGMRKISKYAAIKIINSQIPLLKKRHLANFIIDNDKSLQDTKDKALAVFSSIKEG